MRAWVLVCAFVAACSYDRISVSGDAEPPFDGSATDAPPDTEPAGPRLDGASIPLRIATSEIASLTLLISGPPNVSIDWAITSGGGAFQPASGIASTTSAGQGVITVDYTAPATAGDRAHSLALTHGATRSFPFETRVRALVAAGENAPFTDNAGLAINPDILLGQQVFVPADVVVMRLAVIAQTGGYSGRVALYTNSGGAPRDLVVGSALSTIVAGPNEQRVTPTMVMSGTYWLMANFTASAPIKRNSITSNGQAFATLPTTAAFPATVSATATTNRVLNYYLLFAN